MLYDDKMKLAALGAAVATLAAIYYNLNIMIAPNPILISNTILSFITFALYVGVIIIKGWERKTEKWLGAGNIIIIFLILLNGMFFMWESFGLVRPEIFDFVLPVVFLSIAPFVGLTGHFDIDDFPNMLIAVLPYICFLLVDITIFFYHTYKHRHNSDSL